MRKGLWTTLLVTLAMAGCAVQQAAIAPKGSWITASGNLDVLIAPCGEVYCGTVSKVLANNAMSAAGPSSAAPLAVGARLVSNLHADGDHWQGLIFN